MRIRTGETSNFRKRSGAEAPLFFGEEWFCDGTPSAVPQALQTQFAALAADDNLQNAVRIGAVHTAQFPNMSTKA